MSMRIRTVKPEFHQSSTLATVSREVRGFASALLNWVDDEGYFVSIPAVIAGALYPFDEDGREFVSDGLEQLAGIGYLELFDGHIGLITNFVTHQRINRPTKSRLKLKALKSLKLTEDSLKPHGGLTEASLPEVEGKWKGRGKGSGSGTGKGKRTAAPAVISKAPEQVPLIAAPPPPPREPTRVEVLFGRWESYREDLLEELGAPAPDASYGWAQIGKTFRRWLDLWPDVPLPNRAAELGVVSGGEFRIQRLFEEYLGLDWPAKCTARDRRGVDTGVVQPWPFSALTSEKVWGELVAKLWPDEAYALAWPERKLELERKGAA